MEPQFASAGKKVSQKLTSRIPVTFKSLMPSPFPTKSERFYLILSLVEYQVEMLTEGRH